VDSKYTIVVLISGRGSNLKCLLQNAEQYRIVGVVSNKPDAAGLNIAKASDVPTFVVPRSNFGSIAEQKEALRKQVLDLQPDCVCLAGFMQIIEPTFLETFPRRVVNIHPALLPAFPGLDTHRRALESGAPQHGCSVHLVDAGIDTGPIIAQASVSVFPSDNEQSLAARVLEREHLIYPWVMNNIAKGGIALATDKIIYSDLVKAEAKKLGFLLAI
jgi:phosphoribosylglycinamide formyltransferase-1